MHSYITYNTRAHWYRLQSSVNFEHKKKKRGKAYFAGTRLNAVFVLKRITPEPLSGDLPGKLIAYFDLLPTLVKEK